MWSLPLTWLPGNSWGRWHGKDDVMVFAFLPTDGVNAKKSLNSNSFL